MRLVSVINRSKTQLFLSVLLLGSVISRAQENSPYSRYGWGNLTPGTPISNRGMGGIGTGLVDYDERFDIKQGYERYLKPQTVNFLNPASYGKLRLTSFDLGFHVDNQVLREQNTTEKYKASSANFSYLQLGIPLSRKNNLSMVLGLRPTSNISYNITTNSREYNPETGDNIDSVQTVNEGTGGSYQAYGGIGKAFGNFSLGANVGYYFGTKDISTKKNFVNDSVFYTKGNYQEKLNFGGVFINTGAQYLVKLNKTTRLILGATASFKQDYDATKDRIVETYVEDVSGTMIRIDSVTSETDVKGTVTFPASYSGGFTLERLDKWLIGADFVTTNWDDFRIYNQKDSTTNTWMVKVGGQFIPNAYGSNFWGRVTYRLGFNFGPDYIKIGDEKLNRFFGTAGFGFPIRPSRLSNQYSNLNLSLEYGNRGSSQTQLQENYFRVSLGFTLSDLWFVKRKYD